MKFLVVLSHGLYLRHYGDFIETLIARGHHVRILRTSEKQVDDTRLDRFSTDYPGILLAESSLTVRGGNWEVLDPLRALRDYLRYFHVAYSRSPALFERAARRIPRLFRRLMEQGKLGDQTWLRLGLDRLLLAIERAYPPDETLTQLLDREAPDTVLITPLIDFDYRQLDVLKATRNLGLRSALLVASWDNLTNKGGILLPCERLMVWNDFQKQEAVELHHVEPSRIDVTGAQTFDHWFEMAPQRTRSEFCAEVGLDSERPFLLYVCSSAFVCADESRYLLEWLRALRTCGDDRLREIPVMVRPHPTNTISLNASELLETGPVVIWPPVGTVPMDADRQQDYFESLYFSAALVGVNTSSFLEAGIVRRRSFALPQSSLGPSQHGTLHFRHLAGSGYLATASSWAEHLKILSEHLGSPSPENAVDMAFLETFIRPHGISEPALPHLVRAVEDAVGLPSPPRETTPHWGRVVRAILWAPGRLIAAGYRRRLFARMKAGEAQR